MTGYCKKLTIFEGPDGGGKSTAALTYAAATGAHYVHLGPFKRVRDLVPLYVEAMMPALLGHKDVVMDRSWLSEAPYGNVYRHGKNRLGTTGRRILERLAMRCQASVILCLPPVETCVENFNKRRGDEMLDSATELVDVYGEYNVLNTWLPVTRYNYLVDLPITDLVHQSTSPHLVAVRTAGNADADVMIIGEGFAEVKEGESLYQWPFGSKHDSSGWLNDLLWKWRINESKLTWVNADEFEKMAAHGIKASHGRVIMLGEKAIGMFGELRHQVFTRVPEMHAIPHPAYWRRFRSAADYPLKSIIGDLHD